MKNSKNLSRLASMHRPHRRILQTILMCLILSLTGMIDHGWAADLPITIEQGGASTGGSGIALYRELEHFPAGQEFTFIGEYDMEKNQIRFVDPPWIHLTWPRHLHWKITFDIKTDPGFSTSVSRDLEPAEAESLQKLPVIEKYIRQVESFRKEGKNHHSIPAPELSLYQIYGEKLPEEFSKFDAKKTAVDVHCDNLGNSAPNFQQAFFVTADRKPEFPSSSLIARFTGEIYPNQPELTYHQKVDAKLHHFNLKLGEAQPLVVNLDKKTAFERYRKLIASESKKLRSICTDEGFEYLYEIEKPLRMNWADEKIVVSGLMTPRPDFSMEPVPYATVSVFFDLDTGQPSRISFVRRVHQDPSD